MGNKIVIEQIYKKYYQSIIKSNIQSSVQFVVLTHTVPDIYDFISAIDDMGKIAVIIAIPYSKDDTVYNALSQHYKTLSPTLDNLLDGEYLKTIILNNIDCDRPFVIVEIGGYFSPIINDLHAVTSGNLMGVIEDTEAGHRKYENLDGLLPCPVLSVARSRLKDAENFLVGSSCLNAATQLLNSLDFNLGFRKALILGYGKIGQGLCQLLKDQNVEVCVYDSDPSKRLLALSRGFSIPEKNEALSQADAVFGATGNYSVQEQDIPHIKNGCILFSCSSKQVEFDLDSIKYHCKKTTIQNNLDKYESTMNYFYVASDGKPINFSHGRILVGPLISIVHGEMLVAISEMLTHRYQNKLQEISDEKKNMLAQKWLDAFCNAKTGGYYESI